MTKLKHESRWRRFVRDISLHTPFTWMVLLLLCLWLAFSTALFLVERGGESTSIGGFGEALYWGVAAFSTAGIADDPDTTAGRILGALWIIIGSVLFFGTIIATITGYFMRPMQRPHKMIIDTIEYNLEQLDNLSQDELKLLSETVNNLIHHVEKLKPDESDDDR